MGRWAQRQRRSSTPAPPAAVPTLLSVETIDSDNVRLTFDQAIVVDSGVTPSSDFRVNGIGPDSVSPESDTVVDVSSSGAGWAPGDGWDLTGQPNWITTPIVFPLSGTTS